MVRTLFRGIVWTVFLVALGGVAGLGAIYVSRGGEGVALPGWWAGTSSEALRCSASGGFPSR